MARRRFLSGLLSLVLMTLAAARGDTAPVTVTVTQHGPIESVSAAGDVTGVSEATLGQSFTLVGAQGSQLTVRDAQGNLFRLDLAETDYTPPAPAPAPAVTVPSPVPAQAQAPAAAAATPAPAAAPVSSPDTNTVSDDKVKEINTGLGTPLFSTQSFWKESALLIAGRLGLALEDKTKWERGYRRYFYNEDHSNYAPAAILGGKAYCIALYADASDTPTSALIAFTNDGDYEGVVLLSSKIFELQHPTGAPDPNADQKIATLEGQVANLEQTFEKDRQTEADTLKQNLTALFGDPAQASFGSSVATREDALRWDWNGVSFLLTCQENKYNLLRIVPTDMADNHGRTERIPRDQLGPELEAAVEHRPNGDVVITQIPMADQGLKGYCVPATWERVLRYTGVPGDMYTLSRIGNAGFGGGENSANVAAELDDTLHDYGRRAEFLNIDQIDAISLHRYIDEGIPVFWAVNPIGYRPVDARYALCDRDQDWDTWKKLLDQSRETEKNLPPLGADEGHQVIITGYNADTKEIAWSDPWGRQFHERWMTQEEAQRCSLGQFYIITW